MIKKYAALTLLAVNLLNAQKPTCENSPEPLTTEQKRYCENARNFALLATKNPDKYDHFVRAASRQIEQLVDRTPTSPEQMKHVEAVVASGLLPRHKANHTWTASANRTAQELALPFLTITGTITKATRSGKILGITISGKKVEIPLSTNLQPILTNYENGTNEIELYQTQLSLWKGLTETIKNALTTYDPRNFSTTQWVVIGIVVQQKLVTFSTLCTKTCKNLFLSYFLIQKKK